MKLSQNENEFLAWYFVETGRRSFGIPKNQDLIEAIEVWKELTGNDVRENFFDLVVAIHDSQKNND